MLVTHFERLPASGGHSIERLFRTIRTALPSGCRPRVEHCPTPAQGRFWFPWGIWRAFRSRSDVNHIVGDVHYLALGLPGSRTILTIHDLNRLDGLTGIRRTIYRWLYFTLPLHRCRIVTAISNHTRDQLIQQFPFVSRKIQVIPDCLPEGFASRPKAFDTHRPRILQIGTQPNKNLDRVIEAVSGQSCVLHIIGLLNDKQREALQRHGISYENAVNVSDAEIISAYQRADLITFVSLAEGFGMPIIEAQAIGRAVITSCLSPMREVAADAACLVDPFSVDDIRSGINRVIRDERYRVTLIEAGWKNVERFRPRIVAQEYADLYAVVVARKLRN